MIRINQIWSDQMQYFPPWFTTSDQIWLDLLDLIRSDWSDPAIPLNFGPIRSEQIWSDKMQYFSPWFTTSDQIRPFLDLIRSDQIRSFLWISVWLDQSRSDQMRCNIFFLGLPDLLDLIRSDQIRSLLWLLVRLDLFRPDKI